MVRIVKGPVILENGALYSAGTTSGEMLEQGRKKTISYSILTAHNTKEDGASLHIKFDAMASHDITYVGIIQTARAGGLTSFPLPYVLTNCHNSLCAVGGTINEDDHAFGLSAAKKYGGIYVPAHQAVIHSYMRENFAGCGKMILGSDSHTRYGAIGCMAIGEGGPELVKQLLGRTYDIAYPDVIAVRLTGKPKPGVGPQDVALSLIGAVFQSGFVKNKVLEFIGDGIASLPMEYRNGIDVMTTETTCLSSVWTTDDATRRYLEIHKRADDYKKLTPCEGAVYDGAVEIDLSSVESIIALPFHPSNVYSIREFLENADELLGECEKYAQEHLGVAPGALALREKFRDGKMYVDQGVIAGCAGGTFDNLCAAADILKGKSCDCGEFSLSVYPASAPVMIETYNNGVAAELATAGAVYRSAFCGPCFGAGDVPRNGGLSIRHTTRNFPMREGSKPKEGQIAAVALMDARSIAATAAAGGVLTAADSVDVEYTERKYVYDDTVYKNRVYNGYGNPRPESALVFGPNITDWPEMQPMSDKLLLSVASVITDSVTTTDELIPSGDTSSYRSNPEKLASFTLSRKDPEYVGRAKAMRELERGRLSGIHADTLDPVYSLIGAGNGDDIMLASVVFAVKPGDGSAREQAASCQRVLGGAANVAVEYATKRYRSNLINWGMLPFTRKQEIDAVPGDYIYIEGLRSFLLSDKEKRAQGRIDALLIKTGENRAVPCTLYLENLSDDECRILCDGCLINFYRNDAQSLE